MWIRSQDDRLLIDANKIYVSGTDDPKYQIGDFKYRIYNIGESCNYFLGDYSSKEKAIRVLDEIECLKKLTQKGYFNGIDPFTKVHDIIDNCEVIK